MRARPVLRAALAYTLILTIAAAAGLFAWRIETLGGVH